MSMTSFVGGLSGLPVFFAALSASMIVGCSGPADDDARGTSAAETVVGEDGDAAASGNDAGAAPFVIDLVAGHDGVTSSPDVPLEIKLVEGQIVRVVNQVGVDLALASFDDGSGNSYATGVLAAGHTADMICSGHAGFGLVATAPKLSLSFWHDVEISGDFRAPTVTFVDEATGAPLPLR